MHYDAGGEREDMEEEEEEVEARDEEEVTKGSRK